MPTEEKQEQTPATTDTTDRFGAINWVLLGIGILLLIIGFGTLALANQDASNLPGRLSPFLVLGGYGAIFIGLLLRPKR